MKNDCLCQNKNYKLLDAFLLESKGYLWAYHLKLMEKWQKCWIQSTFLSFHLPKITFF